MRFIFFLYTLLIALNAFRGCIVKWVTESNRPASIIEDIELHTMMTAGRPHAVIPSVSTVRRDIKVSFVKCREKIGKLLKVCVKLYVSGCR